MAMFLHCYHEKKNTFKNIYYIYIKFSEIKFLFVSIEKYLSIINESGLFIRTKQKKKFLYWIANVFILIEGTLYYYIIYY